MKTGLIHIYCGNGKGKTTTGMGLCARAAGYGYQVLIYQFMKNNRTSERKILEQVPNITFVDGLETEKFSFCMTEEEKEEQKELRQKYIESVRGNLRGQLENMTIQRPDGTVEKVKKVK